MERRSCLKEIEMRENVAGGDVITAKYRST